ncbi:MAG TPA: hypothetical protein VHB68_00725 [Steroidobacteraceae bacterium]|nr:hypothetical protein [Steroidobacteraceae bacterium]
MSKIGRSVGIITGAVAMLAAVAAVTAWAGGQRTSTPQVTERVSTSQATERAVAPQVPERLSVPQVPEESATIRDDPTVAPDPKQSADNNVSFPNDI